ncbi:peptidase M50 [Novosphingobium sp.]|uniref:peptidase M50 n=1 Tax=Novosphingobium sp. TaxID=1874826 RepID=UPI003B52B869
MTAPLLSSSWYRIAGQRVRLREHVTVSVHRYRKQVWYVPHDNLTGNSMRLAMSAYMFLSLLDGDRTIDQAWRDLVMGMGETAPSQDEIVNLLSRLHYADMLLSDMPPDTGELIVRRDSGHRRKWIGRLLNPMSITLPLWDPDALLTRLLPLARLMFGPTGALVWLAVVVHAAVLAGQHWNELTSGGPDKLIGVQNLMALSVSFLVIKFLHEMGHGLAVKAFGGEVHELGVMLIVLLPSPYVNASAANAMRSKWQRALIGAAGMAVELFVAALAMQLWTVVDPGLVKSLCYNALVVASVSTLLFNGNPLMRYDGYYILCDLIEMPNLAQRGSAWWGRQVDRLLLELPDGRAQILTRREHWWLMIYPPLSLVYRLVVMVKIALYVATEYFIIGVVMALWNVASGLVLPAIRSLAGLWRRVANHRQPVRMRIRVAMAGAAIAALLFAIPFPHHATAEGVTWLPESAIIRAGADGFIDRQTVASGVQVHSGQVLFQSSDPELALHIDVLRAKIDALDTQRRTDFFGDQARENLTGIALSQARAELDREEERTSGLVSISRTSGALIVTRADEQLADFHKRGDILAFVPPATSRIIRVTVSQDDVGLVRNELRSVRVVLANDLTRSVPVTLIREVPEGSEELPSRALGEQGGGGAATDPTDPHREKAIGRLFQFDLALPRDAPASMIGVHAYARFDLGWEPIAQQFYRRMRQLFLSSLNA